MGQHTYQLVKAGLVRQWYGIDVPHHRYSHVQMSWANICVISRRSHGLVSNPSIISNLQKSSQIHFKLISSYLSPIFKKTSPTKSLLLTLCSWDLLIWQIHLSKRVKVDLRIARFHSTWIQMKTWWFDRWCLKISRVKPHTLRKKHVLTNPLVIYHLLQTHGNFGVPPPF